MQVTESSLFFDGYVVDEILFKINPEPNLGGEEICLKPNISKQVLQNHEDKSKYIVKLCFEINNKNTSNAPFELKITLVGRFTLKGEVKNDTLIQENTVAILFPYLRSLISIVTLNANISPLLLPIMNIAEMLRNSKEENTKIDSGNTQ